MVSRGEDGLTFRLSRGPHGYLIPPPESSICLKRQSLVAALQSGPCRPLYALVLRRTYHHGLSEAVRSALRRIGDVLYASSTSEALVGSVTAVEMLLAEQSDFKLMARRLGALLGEAVVADLCVNKVMALRHRHVHQGEDVTRDGAFAALALALCVLQQVARLAQDLASKAELLSYLDAISALDRHRGGSKRSIADIRLDSHRCDVPIPRTLVLYLHSFAGGTVDPPDVLLHYVVQPEAMVQRARELASTASADGATEDVRQKLVRCVESMTRDPVKHGGFVVPHDTGPVASGSTNRRLAVPR